MFTAQDVMNVMHRRYFVSLLEQQVALIFVSAGVEDISAGLTLPADQTGTVGDCVRIENPYWRNHHKSLH